jgi:branched-subunit amino acid transport protein AzlD
MVMAVLLIYCLKDVTFFSTPFAIPHLVALLFTIIVHFWKSNSMLSIFGGTALFMILSRVI